MNSTAFAPHDNEILSALVQRLAFDAPLLTDLGQEELEQLARLVMMTNLRDDLRRMVELAKIDGEAEVSTFLTNASRTGSWSTIRAYAYGLDRLDQWALKTGRNILELTPKQADDYIYSLRLAGRSPGSIRLDVAGASAFFSYLERRYDAVRNPFRGTKARPAYRPTREIEVPSETELSLILETARPIVKAAVVCMSQRGLRVGALPTLVLDGARFSGWSKGRPVQGVMAEPILVALEDAGLDRKRPFKHLTARLLADRVRRHAWSLAALGKIGSVYSAHDYRHYYAVHEYRERPDIFRLKNLLGHFDIRTTERYLKTLKIL